MRKHFIFLCAVCVGMAFSSCRENEYGTVDLTMDDDTQEDVQIPTQFKHPGVLNDEADFQRMREIVDNREEPYYAGYEKLAADARSQSTYVIKGPFKELYTGYWDGYPNIQNDMCDDFSAAYQNAVMYVATGDEAHAKKSLELLMAYANTVTGTASEPGATDGRPLFIANYGAKIIYATELLRYEYPQGMTDSNFNAICTMLKNHFIPILDTFFATDPYTNGNWGAGVCKAYMAAGIIFDDVEMYKKAVDFFLYGNDNGTILNYIDGDTGQSQESGRDQQHVQLGLGCLAGTCELAYKQGTDLYGVFENRLLKGYEYTAKYNLGYDDVPFKQWTDVTGKYCNWKEISQETKQQNNGVDTRRGEFRPIYEVVYNHYVRRMNLHMPYTEEEIDKNSPEGWNGDHFGFGSFLFTR